MYGAYEAYLIGFQILDPIFLSDVLKVILYYLVWYPYSVNYRVYKAKTGLTYIILLSKFRVKVYVANDRNNVNKKPLVSRIISIA